MSGAKHRGFSLVELMVALTLSLILLGGAVAVVYSSKVTYGENERVARLQENGRAAIELILRDLRAAGYQGCAQAVPFTNTLNASASLFWNFGVAVQGFESTGASSWSPVLPAALTGANPRPASSGGAPADVIAVRTIRAGAPMFRTSTAMPHANADIVIDKSVSDTIDPGTPILISDCNAVAVFELSGFANNGTTATLTRTAGSAAGYGPGNASTDLGFPYQAGALVAPLATVVYYIAPSSSGRGPALWRIVADGGSQPDVPEELIEGVEALEIQYGEDTDGDRIVNRYVSANAIADWTRVVSVSIALLIRSVEPNAAQPDERVYRLLDTNVGPFNDRYQRTTYTTTVTLRNRTP